MMFCVSLANVLLLSALFFNISFIWFQIPLYIYFLIVGYSSYFICSQFYIPAICFFTTSKKEIALTFDDGPNERTIKILDVLKKYNVKASFFCIGKHIPGNEEIIKRIDSDGHSIGIHSYSHKGLFPLYSIKKIKQEIHKTEEEIGKNIGKKALMFRPPFGVLNPLVASGTRKANKKVIGWSIRTLDTVKGDSETIINKVKKRLAPGKIVLLHDTTDGIDVALESLINYLISQDYSIVGLHEVINDKWYE